jgi:hypothetical protein
MSTSMRSALHSLLLLSLLTTPLVAQQATTSYLVRPATAERAPRAAAPPIRGQFLAGFAGMVVGAAAGATTGIMIGYGSGDETTFETAAVVATLVGILGGTTYGVHKYSQAKGGDGSAGAAFGGSALGLLGGPLMWVTVPLGSRWLYNRSRTDTTTAP